MSLQLNPAQHQAVTAAPSNMLVLAGAGSGKTRVLVQRITWLIENENVSPAQILAVTFTNKAAAEMRARIEQQLNMPLQMMWVGTFHGLAHRLLRRHWQEAGLPEGFQIIDSDDQLRLIKRIIKSLNLDDTKWPPKKAQWFVNHQKEQGVRSDKVNLDGHPYTETMQRIYQIYEETCKRSGLVDFSELLLRVKELFETKPDILQHYCDRFQHILVDEFQDTNTIQYAWVKLLAGNTNFVMAVGDDDQSIYSWRGAKVENIVRFSEEFANVTTIRLEQNYRSTQTILTAANKVIENNSQRMGKKLWSDGNQGELISLYAAYNEIDEANYIVSRIKSAIQSGEPASNMAVLYRSNAQSRVIEETLTHSGVPYRVYGGFKFFDRAEIKDILAYMRMVANPDDDAAFERIVNVPTRGIGNTTINELRMITRNQQVSLWQAANAFANDTNHSGRSRNAVIQFINLIESLKVNTKEMTLDEQCNHILEHSGIMRHHQKDTTEKGISRVENLLEFVTATQRFHYDDPELSPLVAFLSYAALEAGEGQADQHEDCVQLMTLHAAKGLEFPTVFLTGMEDGLFPHKMSQEDPDRLEEERRLCYVGITRAMQSLYITHAETRRIHGQETYNRPSRFVREIPNELLNEIRVTKKRTSLDTSFQKTNNSSIFNDTEASDTGFQLGQRVRHPKFGDGTVLNYEGRSAHARIQVKFNSVGTKWLVLSHANLQPA